MKIAELIKHEGNKRFAATAIAIIAIASTSACGRDSFERTGGGGSTNGEGAGRSAVVYGPYQVSLDDAADVIISLNK